MTLVSIQPFIIYIVIERRNVVSTRLLFENFIPTSVISSAFFTGLIKSVLRGAQALYKDTFCRILALKSHLTGKRRHY